jgi:hypothetical protein
MNKDRYDEEISRFLHAWMVRQLIQAANFNRFEERA